MTPKEMREIVDRACWLVIEAAEYVQHTPRCDSVRLIRYEGGEQSPRCRCGADEIRRKFTEQVEEFRSVLRSVRGGG